MMIQSLEINYAFELTDDTRGAWKRTKRYILASWLIDVYIFLRNPNDFEALIHELVESFIAQLLFYKFRPDWGKYNHLDYEKACRIAHLTTTISLPRLKG